MIRTQAYDVETKPTKVDIATECKHVHAEDGKITVGTRVNVKDTTDTKGAVESTPDGKIKPYGLDTDGAYDVEVKEKVADSVIQKHIDKAIKRKKKK